MSKFKRSFVPRNKGGRIVEVDWSQLEVAVLQIESQDPVLANELTSGIDTHSMMTSKVYDVMYEYVVEEVRKHNPVWMERRRQTKRAKFALQYGAYAKRISLLTGWDIKTSQNFIDAYNDRYKMVVAWQDKVAAEVASTAKPFGVDGKLRGQYTSPSGRRFVFETSENWQGKQSFSPMQMKNYPIQGLASDFVGKMTGRLMDKLLRIGQIGKYVYPINTIHDSVIFDVADSVAEGMLFDAVHATYGQAVLRMEELCRGMRPVTIPLKYDITSGSTWSK